MPRGSDESWVGKLNEKCGKFEHFERSRFGNRCMCLSAINCNRKNKCPFWLPFIAFIVKHFSDVVEYTSNGFLEKNRDTISKELVNVLRHSDLEICNLLMALDANSDSDDQKMALDGRVVISAAKQSVKSHTQAYSNGLRISSDHFSHFGYRLPGSIERKAEEC